MGERAAAAAVSISICELSKHQGVWPHLCSANCPIIVCCLAMAAVEVPIQVGLANEAAKICLEPQSGPNALPVLSIMFGMQIPIAALVDALLDFQASQLLLDALVAEQVRQTPSTAEHARTRRDRPGSPAPPPGWISVPAGAAGNTSAPPTAGVSDTASDQESAAAAWLDQSTPTRSPQPPPGLTGPEEPASAVLAVESQPIPLATTRGKGGRAEQPAQSATTRGTGGRAEQPAQSATTTGKGGRAEQWEDRSRRAQKLESRASDLACKGIDYISGESPPGLRPQPAEAHPFRPPPGLAPPPGSSPAPGSAVARETEAAYELSMYQLQSEDSPPPDPIPVLHRLLAGEKYSGPRFPNQDRCKQQ